MALMHINCFSSVLGMCVNFDAIIPETTNGQIGMEGVSAPIYQTLYLLHGMSDDHTIWQRRTSIERYVANKNLAVIMPTTHLAWYSNTTYGCKYMDFVAYELPEICRGFFRGMSEKREDNFVAGLSMGGYGAFKVALTAPERFCAAASLSGALDVSTIHQRIPGRDMLFTGIFGAPETVKGSENDLFHLAETLKASGKPMPKLYQWCGTEDYLYAMNVASRDKLLGLGYDLTYTESEGNHGWQWWDREIQPVLDWLPLK